ncbi:MAG: hypothetical protein J2O48_09240 [Solirubrobacterales bacterium]|nr:hypothetical protein [Solirubrobacterales bacterium]
MLVFVIGQLVLPGIATTVARHRLSGYGHVQRLSLSAFPAIELLFGKADKVSFAMSDYHVDPAKVSKAVSLASQADQVDANIASLSSGLLKMHNVVLHKRGSQLTASGQVNSSDLRSALPLLDSVTPVGAGENGLALSAVGTVPFLGQVRAEADVVATNGSVSVRAAGALGSVLHATVFQNPKLYVQSVTGRRTAAGMSVTATARLR